MMGQANKGAVSISMKFSDKRLLFINCHLEAHNESRIRRKEQFDQIYKQLCLNPDKELFASYLEEQTNKNEQDSKKENVDIQNQNNKKISDEEY